MSIRMQEVESSKEMNVEQTFIHDYNIYRALKLPEIANKETKQLFDSIENEDERFDVYKMYTWYFLQLLPVEIWDEFIKEKNFSQEALTTFTKKYGVYPIQNILHNTNLTDFEKEREIRHLCQITDLTFHDYHSPGVFNGISLSAWEAFVDEFPKLGGFNFKTLLAKYQKFPESQLLYCNTWKRIGKLFAYPDKCTQILFTNMKNEVVNITFPMADSYFAEKSHFENGIFYLNNVQPYYVKYMDKNEQELSQELYSKHGNWKDGFMNIPWNILTKNSIEYLKLHLRRTCQLQVSFPAIETWKVPTIGHVFEKLHHIVGRTDERFPMTKYHYFLKENWEKFEKNVIYNAPRELLFPEYTSSSNKKELDALWNDSFDYFIKDFFHNLEEESGVLVSIMHERIGKIIIPTNKTIFNLLEENPSWCQFVSSMDTETIAGLDIFSTDASEKKLHDFLDKFI